MAFVADAAAVDEQLDAAAHVGQRHEGQLAERTQQHDPARHRHLVLGLRPRLEIAIPVVEFGSRRRTLEPIRVAVAGEPIDVLGEPTRGQRVIGQRHPFVVHLLVAGLLVSRTVVDHADSPFIS